MKILISGFLLVLGFIFGVLYDQSTVVLTLKKEHKAEQGRNALYYQALNECTQNKFKSKDYILDQVRLINKKKE